MTKTRRRSIIALGIISTCLAAGILAWRLSVWNKFTGDVTGIAIEGDPHAPPTHWWNHLYLAKWGWKTMIVFEVSEEDAHAGYDVGYLPFDDTARVEGKINHTRRFRMKIGHEPCIFFAVATDAREILLKIVARSTVDDTSYADAPLH